MPRSARQRVDMGIAVSGSWDNRAQAKESGVRYIPNSKKRAIIRDLMECAKQGLVPWGTTAIIAKRHGTNRRYVDRIKCELSLRVGINRREQSVYEPPMEELVDRGDCLELEQDVADRYDVIKYFHQYRKRNKIAIGDRATFDREFAKWLKIVGCEKLWKKIG